MKDEIREKIFTAIGEASMCWEPRPTGVFDSTAAQKIGERLVAALASAVEVEPLACLADRKGQHIGWTNLTKKGWVIVLSELKGPSQYGYDFWGDTYAECEASAREFLAGLPDKGGE
ncbi:MAG: hypothetical protein M0R06_03925 [Sphaerochaeta sp.]|jgi:hypothetical protein|nr:hypothetical protein [Sphaerochaeta sp.]